MLSNQGFFKTLNFSDIPKVIHLQENGTWKFLIVFTLIFV